MLDSPTSLVKRPYERPLDDLMVVTYNCWQVPSETPAQLNSHQGRTSFRILFHLLDLDGPMSGAQEDTRNRHSALTRDAWIDPEVWRGWGCVFCKHAADCRPEANTREAPCFETRSMGSGDGEGQVAL